MPSFSLVAVDFLRLLAEKVFFARFPQAFGRKSFVTADFLRKWAEKVCGERFPQAFGPTDAMDRSDRRHTYI